MVAEMVTIPDYPRYTEFSLQMRLTLATLADVRLAAVDRFAAAQADYHRLAVCAAPRVEIALYRARCEEILWTIFQIDHAIFDIYALHGRLN